MRRKPGRRAGLTAVAATTGLLAAAAPAAASAPPGMLNQGSSGPAVSRLQHALHVGGSGRFNAATKRAVLAFQRRDGLQVDGVVGPQTWDALFHITPPPASPDPVSGSSTGASSGSGASSSSASSSSSGSSSGSGASSSSGSSSGSSGYAIPPGIVQCESHGNYGAVNSSSGAGGAYQILPSTWQAYGGQGSPQDASPAEQGRIAAAIYAHQGSSAWNCGG